MRNDLELLAPVGSFDSLVAAIQNGANAVYLGGKEFSARASANNFDRDELKSAVEYAHIRGCKVFVTVNTLIKESEKEDFIDYVSYMYKIMVDALILQDIGMASLIRNIFPDFELHASTQMAAHSLNDVKHLVKAGFKRVVLARELNIYEIEYICSNIEVDIEVFVHGALCVCYSGQCLMSSVMGSRSGNRGRCAQPCRQSYKLYNSSEKSYIETDGSYLLSPRDLNTVENIDKIINTGVLSLKIEGRMKKPEYVAAVVRTYREAINQYLENGNIKLNSKKIDNLYTIFNRKFTNGYILGELGSDNMNSSKPNNRGLYIGNVISYNQRDKKLKIKLVKPLRKGDGLNIGGGSVGRIIIGKNIVDYAEAGQIVEIDYIGKINRNTDIYKTSDARLNLELQETFIKNKENIKIPLKFHLNISIGEFPVLTILDYDENMVSVIGDKKVEEAIKIPLSDEKVETQLSKLGDTPYVIEELSLNLEGNSSLPISELNNLRRKGIETISNERVKIINRNLSINEVSLEYKRSKKLRNFCKQQKLDSRDNVCDSLSNINVSCNNLEQLAEVLNFEVGKIYYRDINTLEDAMKLAKDKNRKVSYYLPRIIRSYENDVYDKLKKIGYEKLEKLESIRVSNFGELEYIKSNYNITIDISSWLNVINYESIVYYRKNNVGNICFSQETSIEQIRRIFDEDTDNEKTLNSLEYLVYGNVEMMISEYCPMGVLTKDCKRNKRDAFCNKSVYYLESQDGNKFRLSQDNNCRTTIYSSEKVNLLEYIGDLKDIGIRNFEVSLYFENAEETKRVIEAFVNEIDENSEGKRYSMLKTKSGEIYSTGHLFKEID